MAKMRTVLLLLATTSALERPRATTKAIRTTKADVEAVAITEALQNIKLKVTGGATTGLAHRLEVGAFFGGWYALNIYYNIINKKVLKTVGLPWLVSWAQLVVGALYALVGWGICRTGQPAVKDAWPVAVAHCGQQVTTVISLGAGAVSMTHVVKALEPLFSAAVNAVVRGEILPLPVYAALIPVVGGVAVAIATDLSFNPLSFSAAMTSNLFSGLRAVLSKANLERTKQTAPELFGAATIGAACILAPLAFMVEGSKLSVLDDLDTNRVALQVALSGLFHCVFRCPWSFLQRARGVASMACGGIARETSSTRARRRLDGVEADTPPRRHRRDGGKPHPYPNADLNNEVMYMCLARVNPVTLAVGNTVKRVVIIAAAMVVLGEAMEPVAMVGTTVAIAGVLLYSILKQRLA
jgi:solute carrier family 35 protein E1